MMVRTMEHSVATDTSIARGVLVEAGDGQIVFGLRGTDYQLHLQVNVAMNERDGAPLIGRIHAQARRVDLAPSGGCYIEPVYGRPRRLQGRIAATDPQNHSIVVRCACPFVCALAPGQQASAFDIGDFVTFDVERGARFEPVAAAVRTTGTDTS